MGLDYVAQAVAVEIGQVQVTAVDRPSRLHGRVEDDVVAPPVRGIVKGAALGLEDADLADRVDPHVVLHHAAAAGSRDAHVAVAHAVALELGAALARVFPRVKIKHDAGTATASGCRCLLYQEVVRRRKRAEVWDRVEHGDQVDVVAPVVDVPAHALVGGGRGRGAPVGRHAVADAAPGAVAGVGVHPRLAVPVHVHPVVAAVAVDIGKPDALLVVERRVGQPLAHVGVLAPPVDDEPHGLPILGHERLAPIAPAPDREAVAHQHAIVNTTVPVNVGEPHSVLRGALALLETARGLVYTSLDEAAVDVERGPRLPSRTDAEEIIWKTYKSIISTSISVDLACLL